jgi:hypothetical protein
MEINHENKQVVKVLNALIDGRVQKGLVEYPIAIVNEEHIKLEDMSVNRGMEILNELFIRGDITILSKDEFTYYEEKFNKSIDEKFEALLKARRTTKNAIIKACEQMLKKFGFDTESVDFDIDKEFWDLEDYKRIVSNTVLEKKFKSPEIEKYKIQNDLFKLRKYIESGRDFYNMDKDWILFNQEKQILTIGLQRVSLKRTPKIYGQYIIEHIIENGIKEKYFVDELIEDNVIPDAKKNRQYSDAIRELNKKVREQTSEPQIKEFIKKDRDYLRIKDTVSL